MEQLKKRFTGYLVIALDHAIYNYWKKKNRYDNHFVLMEDKELQEMAENDGIEKFVLAYFEEQWDPDIWMDSIQEDFLVCELKKLSPGERTLIFLRIIKNMRYEQIGQLLKMPEKKVKMRYYYIIEKMRRKKNGI